MGAQEAESLNMNESEPLVGVQKQPSTGATTRVAPTLGNIVGAFKSITTVEYTRGVEQRAWPPFNDFVWQRNYYEHIVRDEHELSLIRKYILDNPLNWQYDIENPYGDKDPERADAAIDRLLYGSNPKN